MVGRRSVLQVLTALGGLGALSGASAASEGPELEGKSRVLGQTEQEAPPVGTEALLEFLAAKYGDVLTDDQIDSLEGDVADSIRAAQGLDEADLENGASLAFAFKPYRGEE